MATLIRDDDNEEIEVKDNDNSDLIDKSEELGLVYGCQDGRCGSCRVKVIEGMEHISDKTQNEDDILGDDGKHRLFCQCKLKPGRIRIEI